MTDVLDIYGRVSRLGDKRQRSTTGQVEDCTARVLERDAIVGEVHVDSGRSAWNPRVHRPAWDRLMERLESGATGGVVVFDLARFSRRPIEGERLIAAAERGLLVLDSEDDYDLTSASGKKAFRDQLNSAAYESDRLSTRVKRGKKLKAMKGESNHAHRPFGWEPDGITPREDEAEELRSLTKRFLAGESQNALVRDLNARGVATSFGGAWTHFGLRQVLTRPRNAGLLIHQGQLVGALRDVTPILDEDPERARDIWEQVCALYDSRRRGRPVSETYLCSGIIGCGLCGHHLTGRPRTGAPPYPDGSIRRQYWCQARAHGGGCGRITVDQRGMDAHIGLLVVEILSDPRHAQAVQAAAEAVAEERAELDRVDAETAEAEHVAAELAARLGRGELSLARYDAAMAPLDRRLARLRERRAELGRILAEVPSAAAQAASRAELVARWEDAKVPQKRALIRQALRGRRLVVMPGDPNGPRRFDPHRIELLPDGQPV